MIRLVFVRRNVPTPERRFIHQGLYLDHLEGESVEVFCCIDTSGSVGEEELSLFVAELRGILSAYPMLRCYLWYADASCYGPYELISDSELPTPEGGAAQTFDLSLNRLPRPGAERRRRFVFISLTVMGISPVLNQS